METCHVTTEKDVGQEGSLEAGRQAGRQAGRSWEGEGGETGMDVGGERKHCGGKVVRRQKKSRRKLVTNV